MGQYSGPERIKAGVGGSFRNVINVTSGTRTMTVDESGSLVLLNLATGIDITLPAITSSNEVGTWYEFVSILAASTESYTITAQSGDLLLGRIWTQDTDTANGNASYAADGSDDLIITMSDTADLPGNTVKVTAITTTAWLVQGTLHHTGNAATPFS